MGDPLLLIAGILMVVIGIAGIIIPGLPGVVLVYLGLFFVAWSDGFARVGWITLTILLLIGAVAWLIDLFTTVYGARRIGASRWAAVGAALGMLIGFWFGLPGILLGPFLGALWLNTLSGRISWKPAKPDSVHGSVWWSVPHSSSLWSSL
jgi:uncharacterized protein YqgC (DUF456 family)